MSIQKIYTKNKSKFSDRIETLSLTKNIEFCVLEKEDVNFDEIDSLVIFHEDHNLDGTGEEIRDAFERKLRPIHKIDINGTKQVIISHFGLWMERNKIQTPLFIGTDQLIDNPKTEALMEQIL